jgi:26S proteasome regulatory subunit N8
LSADGVKRSFASSRNDQLLVVYLSSLLRAVIALHALVDNKATIGRAELEEGGGGEDKEKDKDKKGKNDEKKDEKDGKKDPSKSDSKGL